MKIVRLKTLGSKLVTLAPGTTSKQKFAIAAPSLISLIFGLGHYIRAISGLRQAMAEQMAKDIYSGQSAVALANGGMEFYERAYRNALFSELLTSIGIAAVGVAISFFMWYHASVITDASKGNRLSM